MRYGLTRTPLPLNEIKRRFEQLAVDGRIKAAAVPILTSLVAIENANGGSIWNHNWGNITVADQSSPHFVFPGNERLFRWARTHEEGLDALLHRLTSPTHQRMLDAANAGDVKSFVWGLTVPHPETGMVYCDTCDPDTTLAGYEAMVRQLGGVPTTKTSGGGGLGFIVVAALGLAGIGLAIWKGSKKS